jgi:hypothetical protein
LPAPPPRPDTEAVSGKPASEPDSAWRPRGIWLPCAPTFACSGALIMAARAAAVMGSWDTPAPGLSSLAIGADGQGVLAAVDVGILMAGAKRPRLAHLKSPARARLGACDAFVKGTSPVSSARLKVLHRELTVLGEVGHRIP